MRIHGEKKQENNYIFEAFPISLFRSPFNHKDTLTVINDTENAMDDKKTNIKFTDDAIELGDVDTFIAREWSEKYGEKITELAEAASGGANDFVSKINSMGMSLEQLLGQNLSELISSDLFSADLSARLSAASSAGADLTRLETNEIAFSAGSFNFSILGSNFSADL